ncbi:hypothetical protein [Methanosphaerula subterraneus]|uniref:hypothetical protein n=1 Tax=Methanosphaerula subterraneus TaxID=3350244 RepID=UPI003F84C70D
MIPTSPPLHRYRLSLLITIILCAVVIAAGAATTEVHLVKYASDRTTVLSEKTVSADWMSQNLPVLGDGTTHYYHQGPTFDQANLWDPTESKNVQEKDMGAVKGTNLKDLCNLVGGMASGDTIEVRSEDGFSKQFTYGSIYSPPARQGPIGLVWFNADEGMVPAYQTGMRLVFFADTSVNPWHLHVFGNSDMQATIPRDEWHYFNGVYPTTTGLSVQSVQELRIYSTVAPQTITTQQTTAPVQTTLVVTTLQPTPTPQTTQVQTVQATSLATTSVIPVTTLVVSPITTSVSQTATLTSTVPVTVGSTSVQTGITQVPTVVQQISDAGIIPVSSLMTVVPVNNTTLNNTTVNTTAVQPVILSSGTLPISTIETLYTAVPLSAATSVPTTTTAGGVTLTGGIAYTLGTGQETVTQAPTPKLPALMTTPGGQIQPSLQPTTASPKSRSITGSVNLSFNLTAGGASGNADPLVTGVSTLLLWPLPLQTQASSFFEAFWWITRALVH